MAKRRDRLIEQAEARQQGAAVKVCRKVKALSLTLSGQQQVRNEKGKLVKIISTLKCFARIERVPGPIEATFPVEIEESGGGVHELDEISAAGRQFIELLKAKFLGAAQAKNEEVFVAERQEQPITLQRPPSAARSENMRRVNAERIAKKAKMTPEELRAFRQANIAKARAKSPIGQSANPDPIPATAPAAEGVQP